MTLNYQPYTLDNKNDCTTVKSSNPVVLNGYALMPIILRGDIQLLWSALCKEEKSITINNNSRALVLYK